jgi:uncharacterized protein YbjT (DUF2867 family)
MKVAITGASGFIGRNLIQKFANSNHEIIALARSPIEDLPANATWKYCELYSLKSTLDALAGVDAIFYLVHSMLPSSQLFQGDFHDTDLLIADNISHSCQENKIKHIIYLGGLVPEGFISKHLQSRKEVEGVLQATGIPLTVFRAGMVVGPGGSSFEILNSLVQRLPAMILPSWTRCNTQAVALDDVLSIFESCLSDKRYLNQTIDLVNGEKLTYKAMMSDMAKALGVNRLMIPVPLNSTGFSKLWVTIFGNSNYSLVAPLIDSLLCELPQDEPIPLIKNHIKYKSFYAMVKGVIEKEGKRILPRPRRKIIYQKSVRSIQRLPACSNKNSEWIAREYMRWLPIKFRSLIRVKIDSENDLVSFQIGGTNITILLLKYISGNFEDDRQKFHIVGGLLSKRSDTGWLEFRQVENKKYSLSAIHEFVPSLPWFIYVCTQAPMHYLVMNSFGRHLEKMNASGG